MAEAHLTHEQAFAIETSDALMVAAGLPSYTELLGKLVEASEPRRFLEPHPEWLADMLADAGVAR